MSIGDLVEISDNKDHKVGDLGVVTYIINNIEVEIECFDGPWIYYKSQLEVKNGSSISK
jgi:hypothetical protein